jgi:hypothetical protein
VEKGQQVVRFPQAFDGQGKRNLVQHPGENPVDQPVAQ